MVAQYYEADVNKEHVIRGNAAIIKCLIPSFVADFVDVVSWHTDQEDVYYPGTDYGSSRVRFVFFLFWFRNNNNIEWQNFSIQMNPNTNYRSMLFGSFFSVVSKY